jgi:hypothetical protein
MLVHERCISDLVPVGLAEVGTSEDEYVRQDGEQVIQRQTEVGGQHQN